MAWMWRYWDPERVDRLRTVFWDMTKITTQVETIEHTGTREDGGWTESILHITITPRTPDRYAGVLSIH